MSDDGRAEATTAEVLPGRLLSRLELARPLSGRWAVAAMVFAFALYLTRWGPSTVRAFEQLADPVARPVPTVLSLTRSLIESGSLLIVGVIALYVIASCTGTAPCAMGMGRPSRSGTRGRGILSAAAVAVISFAAARLGFLLGAAIEIPLPSATGPQPDPHPEATSPATSVLNVIDSGLGGAVEEIVVMALIVVAMLTAPLNKQHERWRWPTIYIVAIAVRVVFHAYYGVATMIGLAIWAGLIVALYQFTSRVWPIFVAHFLHNVISTGASELVAHYPDHEALWSTTRGVLQYGFLITGAVLVMILLLRTSKHEHPQDPDRTGS